MAALSEIDPGVGSTSIINAQAARRSGIQRNRQPEAERALERASTMRDGVSRRYNGQRHEFPLIRTGISLEAAQGSKSLSAIKRQAAETRETFLKAQCKPL